VRLPLNEKSLAWGQLEYCRSFCKDIILAFKIIFRYNTKKSNSNLFLIYTIMIWNRWGKDKINDLGSWCDEENLGKWKKEPLRGLPDIAAHRDKLLVPFVGEPLRGLEPPTRALRMRCSTN
jgi:hypothetical protein